MTFSNTALHQARLSFIDTLACIYAGQDEPQVHMAVAAMRNSGGLGGVVSPATREKFSAPVAAYINGVTAHALDFDDYEVPASTHPSAPVVSALLALAGLRTVSLQQLIDAYLVGYETIVRLGEALGYGHYMAGWHATSTIGSLGAAAASAKLLNLNSEQFAAAVSMATSSAAGLKRQFGSTVKALHAGLAARTGVESSLLAEVGVDANLAIMEQTHGFLSCYGTPESPGFALPLSKLGASNGIDEFPPLRKPWPSCAYTHRSIEAALALFQHDGFSAHNIRSVNVRVPEPYARVASFTDPDNSAQARFSITYCVASALTDGVVSPHTYTPAALMRADVRTLMQCIQIEAYTTTGHLDDMSPSHPDTVRAVLHNGQVVEKTIADVSGGTNRPMNQPEILQKYRLCGGPKMTIDKLLDTPTDHPFRLNHA